MNKGRHKYESAKWLIESGIDLRKLSYAGQSVLVAACANPDCDPQIVTLLLDLLRDACSSEEEFVRFLNLGSNPRTLKWKTIYFVSKCISRTFVWKASGLISSLALSSGSTALHYAVIRGDLEILNILLAAGADPFVKNGLGLDCFSLCEVYGPFPNLENTLISNVDVADLAGKVGVSRVQSMIARRTGDIDIRSFKRNKSTLLFPKRPADRAVSIATGRLFSNESNLTSDEESDVVIVEDDDVESH